MRARVPSSRSSCPPTATADRLPRLVAALEAQSLPSEHFEVLIVDNGSMDDTPAVLEHLAKTTSIDLHPLRIDVNAGPAPARNLGWRHVASGLQFISFLLFLHDLVRRIQRQKKCEYLLPRVASEALSSIHFVLFVFLSWVKHNNKIIITIASVKFFQYERY